MRRLKCTKCGETKAINAFPRDRAKVKRGGRTFWCRKCIRVQTADYRVRLAQVSTCNVCGKKTGRPKAMYCDACRPGVKAWSTSDLYFDRFDRKQWWTKARIIKAMQEWERKYRKPPTADDWGKGRIGRGRIGYRGRTWPSVGSVQFAFGSWNAAIAAAGFIPLPPGRPRR